MLDYWFEHFHRPGRTGYVLTTPDGKPVPPDSRRDIINELLEKAELNAPFRGWHALRHRYAYEILTLFGEISWLSKWLGHSSLSITQEVYEHLCDEDACELAYQRLQGSAPEPEKPVLTLVAAD